MSYYVLSTGNKDKDYPPPDLRPHSVKAKNIFVLINSDDKSPGMLDTVFFITEASFSFSFSIFSISEIVEHFSSRHLPAQS